MGDSSTFNFLVFNLMLTGGSSSKAARKREKRSLPKTSSVWCKNSGGNDILLFVMFFVGEGSCFLGDIDNFSLKSFALSAFLINFADD